MKKHIQEVFHHIHRSFTNDKTGYSARKLSSFWFMCLVTFIHAKYCSPVTAYDFLVADCIMILLLLGIVTVQNIIEFKNGGKSDPPNPAPVP